MTRNACACHLSTVSRGRRSSRSNCIQPEAQRWSPRYFIRTVTCIDCREQKRFMRMLSMIVHAIPCISTSARAAAPGPFDTCIRYTYTSRAHHDLAYIHCIHQTCARKQETHSCIHPQSSNIHFHNQLSLRMLGCTCALTYTGTVFLQSPV